MATPLHFDTATSGSKTVRILATVTRLLMGLAFTVFGSNGFFHFLPQPPMSGVPAELFGAFIHSGYMMQLIFGTQLLVGILLLTGFFVPLALALIAPVLVNILCFHLVINPSGIGPGLFVTILEIFLVWAYRKAFIPMLAPRVTPG